VTLFYLQNNLDARDQKFKNYRRNIIKCCGRASCMNVIHRRKPKSWNSSSITEGGPKIVSKPDKNKNIPEKDKKNKVDEKNDSSGANDSDEKDLVPGLKDDSTNATPVKSDKTAATKDPNYENTDESSKDSVGLMEESGKTTLGLSIDDLSGVQTTNKLPNVEGVNSKSDGLSSVSAELSVIDPPAVKVTTASDSSAPSSVTPTSHKGNSQSPIFTPTTLIGPSSSKLPDPTTANSNQATTYSSANSAISQAFSQTSTAISSASSTSSISSITIDSASAASSSHSGANSSATTSSTITYTNQKGTTNGTQSTLSSISSTSKFTSPRTKAFTTATTKAPMVSVL
jgi:hypothetical protein